MNKSKRILSLLLLCVICVMVMLQPVHARASAGMVTGYQKITWGISTGRYYVNGIHAFCSEYNKSWPTVGTQITSIVPCTNELVRKMLYYGYHGPGNTLGTDDRAHVLTAVAVSNANIGVSATDVKPKYNEFYWSVVNNPSLYPSPPNNFKAYFAIPSSSKMQTLAFYEMEKNGYVVAQKSSAEPALTTGNPCYSLEGAQYGIYTDASLAESTRVGTLTMNAEGRSNTVELAPGNYYACEITAPKGYEKSAEVVSFTVTSEQTITLNFTDKPKTYTIDVLLQKVDSETGLSEPQGQATLEGAQFLVKYYSGLWEENVDPGSLQETPARTWVFATDEEGKVRIAPEYKVEGDELYTTFPMGTLTIQEIKASEGYLVNEQVFVRQITQEGMYEPPTVKEEYIDPEPYDIELPKTGSSATLLMVLAGVVLCSTYIYLTTKKRRK